MKNCLQKRPATGWLKSVLIVVFMLTYSLLSAQTKTITGSVSDQSTGESMPGATIIVKGTTKGTTTDMDGNFSLSLSPTETTLVVSFVGYETTEVAVGTSLIVKVSLVPAKTSLQEVVVVGYGTAKVKDLTASITTVKSEDIVKTPSSQPMQALQGKVPGLQIVSSGTPGSSPTVRIRGVGSYVDGEGAPLYIVDGMFYDNIDFLSPNDINTVSILKDASAAAIYGVKAANGVVLIETKSGSFNKKTEVTYNGYYGFQNPQNVVKMANSQQFGMMALESGSAADQTYILNAMQRYGRSRINPNVPDVNTDWYKEILQVAPQTSHSFDINGGTEKARFALGTNYFYQDGILKMKNEYERLNLKAKLDVKVNNWLTVGGNVIYSNASKFSPQNSVWNQAYFAVPVLPVYDENLTGATPVNYANAQDLGYRSGQNPFPAMDFNIDRMKIKKLSNNYYADFTLIPNTLSFKSTYSYNYSSIDQRVVNLPWFIGNSFQNPDATITRTISLYETKIWDNVLTYQKKIGAHNLTVMGGTSFKDEAGLWLSAQGKDFPTDKEQTWYLNQSLNIPANSVHDGGFRQYAMSYFGRVSYNYDDRYLVYGTLRRDGSNKYQEKYGLYPAIGLGWVISEEAFMDNVEFMQFLKLRASWGQLGNENIAASDGALTTNIVKTTLGGIVYSGTVVNNSFSWLKWELTEETNIGLTSRLFNEKLTVDFDYFTRDTKNAAIPVINPGVGNSVLRPVGVIRNSGIELSLAWTNKISNDFSYTVSANFSTLKNQAIDLYGQTYLDGGTAEFRQRTYLNEPLMAFYGRQVAGVYQNQAEIDADPVAVENGLVPGDFKYVDQNKDGKIDDDDRVILGSYLPNIIYGGNVSINWKNFDFSASIYGQSGNKVLNRKRGELIWTSDGNLDADLAINRWHGEGTSNEYPSSAGLRKGWNQKMSDFFVEDGSFFRIQNIQLGYTLKNNAWLGGNFPETRLYFTAERPYSAFSYNGFTPETANGWDTQTYPVAAVYLVGINVKF